MEKISELARYVKCKWILLEFHSEIMDNIAFPTSISDFSYDLGSLQIEKKDLILYEKNGFRLAEEHDVEQWGRVIREQRFDLVLSF